MTKNKELALIAWSSLNGYELESARKVLGLPMIASIAFSLSNVKAVLRSMRVHGGTFSVTSKILCQDQATGKRTQRVCQDETSDQKFRRHLYINLGK